MDLEYFFDKKNDFSTIKPCNSKFILQDSCYNY